MPWSVAPRSLAPAFAPAFAIAIAIPRPMPRPEPVTSAALPSSNPIVHHLLCTSGVRHDCAVNPERLTGHHICLVRCQVDRDCPDLVGTPESAGREVGRQPAGWLASGFEQRGALEPAEADAGRSGCQ